MDLSSSCSWRTTGVKCKREKGGFKQAPRRTTDASAKSLFGRCCVVWWHSQNPQLVVFFFFFSFILECTPVSCTVVSFFYPESRQNTAVFRHKLPLKHSVPATNTGAMLLSLHALLGGRGGPDRRRRGGGGALGLQVGAAFCRSRFHWWVLIWEGRARDSSENSAWQGLSCTSAVMSVCPDEGLLSS